MRAQRLKRLLCKDWMYGAGGGSEHSGKNGGMEWTCGRLLYYDEIMKEFASNESSRLEFLKQISWDQAVQHLRSVKTLGRNGQEQWGTQILLTIHYESHWISTNLGPCGIKGNEEPTDNRMALIDRAIAHCVRAVSTDASSFNEEDFNKMFSDPAFLIKLDKFRVMTGLVASILMFIKHIPFAQPDTAYALTLFSAWDKMVCDEFNLARPTPRKQTKRRMTLMALAVEGALAKKIFIRESAAHYPDMHPDEDGMLEPYSVNQLVDVIRGLQEAMDFEIILNAWSHGLDYSPATSAHVFHVKTLWSNCTAASSTSRSGRGRRRRAATAACRRSSRAAPQPQAESQFRTSLRPPAPAAAPTARPAERERDAAALASLPGPPPPQRGSAAAAAAPEQPQQPAPAAAPAAAPPRAARASGGQQGAVKR